MKWVNLFAKIPMVNISKYWSSSFFSKLLQHYTRRVNTKTFHKTYDTKNFFKTKKKVITQLSICLNVQNRNLSQKMVYLTNWDSKSFKYLNFFSTFLGVIFYVFCCFCFQSSKNENAKNNISGNKEDFLNTKQEI